MNQGFIAAPFLRLCLFSKNSFPSRYLLKEGSFRPPFSVMVSKVTRFSLQKKRKRKKFIVNAKSYYTPLMFSTKERRKGSSIKDNILYGSKLYFNVHVISNAIVFFSFFQKRPKFHTFFLSFLKVTWIIYLKNEF